jgi:predicted AAA+ superfamily ATPase
MHDLPYNLEKKLDKLLLFFPCLVITGARQAGKTTIAKALRPDWGYFDLENIADRTLILEPKKSS